MFQNRKLIWALAILPLILIILNFIIFFDRISVSDVTDAESVTTDAQAQCLQNIVGECLILPILSGLTINSAEITFPDDFETDYQLVVMPFDREQQELAVTWLPLFQELVAETDQADLWSIAALPELNAGIRLLVLGGLSAAISDADIRPQITAVFLADQQALLDQLAVESPDDVRVFIMDAEGIIYYTDHGVYTDDAGIAFRAAFQELLAQ